MLVTLKNLQQQVLSHNQLLSDIYWLPASFQTFQIEIAATDTVSPICSLWWLSHLFLQVKLLKEKIESVKGESYKASEQKLIYAGKILGKS